MSTVKSGFTFSQGKTKKFRPPLKSTASTPGVSPTLTPSSNIKCLDTSQNPCPSDSLPATQTHTVLSYCDNYEEEKLPESPQPTSEDSSLELISTDSNSEHESESEKPPSRFRAHRPTVVPGYGYNSLLHKKRTVADLERGVGKTKRVQIVSPNVLVRGVGGANVRSEKDLSVYDYQPTPPHSVGGAREKKKKRKMDVSGYCKTTEEQAAIDREVVELIQRTKEELKVIRERYATRAKQPIHNYPTPHKTMGVVRKPLPLFFTSELVLCREE